MVKKCYYGDESLSLAWDRIKVRQIPLFITTMRLNQVKIDCRYHLEVVATLTLRFTLSFEKFKFSIKDFLVNIIKSAVSCEFGYTLTEEILNGKLDFSFSNLLQLTTD